MEMACQKEVETSNSLSTSRLQKHRRFCRFFDPVAEKSRAAAFLSECFVRKSEC